MFYMEMQMECSHYSCFVEPECPVEADYDAYPLASLRRRWAWILGNTYSEYAQYAEYAEYASYGKYVNMQIKTKYAEICIIW